MIAKLKHAKLTLGLLILLVVPAGAQNTVDGNAQPDAPPIMFAGGSSLVTDNREPLPANDRLSPGPELVVAKPLFEFEPVLEGEAVEHDFLIANRGAGPLAIHQVRTG